MTVINCAQFTERRWELCREESTGQEQLDQAADVSGKQFICKVCGYIYEGKVLPEDFICPLCKRGVEDFEEVQQ